MYRLFILCAFTVQCSFLLQGQTTFFGKSNQFFSTFVQNNNIDYNSIKAAPSLLNDLVDSIANVSLEKFSQIQRKAYLINAYNLLVINAVIAEYPVERPTNIEGFFDRKKHMVGGQLMSLNQLEKIELLKKYKDPRLHFVLVCAAKSCPAIAPFSYQPTVLDQQLSQQTKKALKDSLVLYYDNNTQKLYLSKIFDWYRDDFSPNVLMFIQQYSLDSIPNTAKKNYLEYDWTLNDIALDSVFSIQNKKDFTPIIVAATLPKKTFEINLFNSVFTANYGYNHSRGTYFTGFFQFGYGLTGKLDLGIDVLLKSNRVNDVFEASPFKVFEFRRENKLVRETDSLYVFSDFGLSHIGPRVRWSPFKKIALSFEQGIYIPIPTIPTGNNFDKAWYWVTQFYYDHQFNSRFGIFAALTFWQPIVPQQRFKFQLPFLKVFFSWYATNRFTLYATTTSLTEWGIGAKYLFHPNFEIQALYTYYVPIPGIYQAYVGDAQNVMTFNVGIRYRFKHQ